MNALPVKRQDVAALVQVAVTTRSNDAAGQAIAAIAATVDHALRRGWSPSYDATWFESAGPLEPAAAEAALALLEPLCEPAGVPFASAWLTKLRVAQRVPKDTHPDDVQAAAAFMAAELGERWPADVIEAACRAHVRASPFFPTLSDLWQRCEEFAGRRETLRTAIRISRWKHLDQSAPAP